MSTTKVANISNLAGSKTITTDDLIDRATCRAWVLYDGTTNTGGNCTILGSFNVSSVTDGGGGVATINFTNAMPDINYAFAGSVRRDAKDYIGAIHQYGAKTVNALPIVTMLSNAGDCNGYDNAFVSVIVFR